jgi:cellulose synthase/poly-beta-1,6-N-acetylglucosamine synthase-like glycosyltransferase
MDSLLGLLLLLILLQGLSGAIDGITYWLYVRDHLRKPQDLWTPPASVIVPCKGLDYELKENLEAVLFQDYPSYEVIFVTASANDPSTAVLHSLLAENPKPRITLIVAGVSDQRGEKVNNLMQAVERVSSDSVVLAFTDSDSRPGRNWLRNLVSPLKNEKIGACTGYRWFFPVSRNFATLLRVVWNGSIATLLRDHNHNFAWGGSMAIRRSTFERIGVLRYWENSISDDYSLTRALRDAQLKVEYEPRCLIASHGECVWRELLEWSTRQIVITKIYSRSLWQLALASQFPFVIGWWWGIGRLVQHSLHLLNKRGGPWHFADTSGQLALVMALIYFFSIVRGLSRLKAVNLIFSEQKDVINRDWWCHVFLGPLVSTLTAYDLLASLLTSTLKWRGVWYEVKSPAEVRVLKKS